MTQHPLLGYQEQEEPQPSQPVPVPVLGTGGAIAHPTGERVVLRGGPVAGGPALGQASCCVSRSELAWKAGVADNVQGALCRALLFKRAPLSQKHNEEAAGVSQLLTVVSSAAPMCR